MVKSSAADAPDVTIDQKLKTTNANLLNSYIQDEKRRAVKAKREVCFTKPEEENKVTRINVSTIW